MLDFVLDVDLPDELLDSPGLCRARELAVMHSALDPGPGGRAWTLTPKAWATSSPATSPTTSSAPATAAAVTSGTGRTTSGRATFLGDRLQVRPQEGRGETAPKNRSASRA